MDADRQMLYSLLDNDLNENCLFLADRLHTQYPDDLNWTHLRSLASLRLGLYALAADYSRDAGISGKHLGCSYVFAQTCLYQKNHAEGIAALEQSQPFWDLQRGSDKEPSQDRFFPNSSAASRLLGKLYKAAGDSKTASMHFVAALEASPFMWDAFTELCDIGMPLHVSNIFKAQPIADLEDRHESANQASTPVVKVAHKNVPRQRKHLGNASQTTSGKLARPTTTSIPVKNRTEGAENVVRQNSNTSDVAGPAVLKLPVASRKRHRPGFEASLKDTSESRPGLDPDDVFVDSTSTNLALSSQQRRSARVLGQRVPNPQEPARPPHSRTDRDGEARQGLTKSRHPNAPGLRRTGRPESSVHEPSYEAKTPPPRSQHRLQVLVGLLDKFGAGYYHLNRCDPKLCLEALSSLPVEHQAAPWVLSRVGKAHYELMAYKDAKVTFQALRKVAPSWIEGLDVYSTVLWHLKEDVALAFLAHELTESFYHSPETWCVMGNSFSVQKLRTEAVDSFRRASQLAPQTPQPFTLLGYEHMDLEEYPEATASFRRALQVDPRHYLAWIGLGRVQEKLGQFKGALRHYLQAEKLNRRSAILLTYIAKLFNKHGRHQQALDYLQRAIKLEPPDSMNGLIRMQTGEIYLQAGCPAEAIREITLVKEIAPDEPRVYFLLGQAYAALGPTKNGSALKCFTIALSLAPWSNDIKEAMLALDSEGPKNEDIGD